MASVLDLIKHYQHAIDRFTNDEQKILKCINKLFQLDVTVQHLQETGVGRTVNALRKEPGDVGQAARALVYKWKVMVAAEESDQEGDHRNDTNYNGHISERDSEDSTPQSKSRHDQYEKSSKSSKSTDDYRHMNGDSSSHKRRHHSTEDEEPETKKSKHASTNDDKYKRKHVKSESSESDTQDTDNSQSDSSESDTSQSSEEDRKPKYKIKEEKQEQVKSSNSSKHTSHSSHKDRKSDSASEKRHDSSEKHSKQRSESTKSEKSPEQKLSSSHKQSSTKDKESSSNKKEKSSHKSIEKDKKSESSSKHSSSKKESSSKADKHKNSSEKHSSASEKQNSSNGKAEKTKEKSSSKELSRENHKSRESSSSKHSSSSKDRSSKDRSSKDKSSKDKSSKDDSSKDRSREKHSSSKESDHSQKSDKKHSSDGSSKDRKEKHKKESDKSGDDKKKHSHSSSKSSKSSSSKSTEDIPKKKAHMSHSEDSDDGIDCGSGASFAEALGMISPTKPKKKTNTFKEFQSPNAFPDLSPASLLAPTAKLTPLPALEISALPEISPNYKPRPPPKLLPHFTDEDAMNHVISSKNQRTKVYSGNKVIGKIPTLYEMCVHVLQEHIDALEYTGGVPYEILKPVVDMASPQQLFMLEHFNPYLMDDTDHLWQKFCEKHFRNKQRQEMETWREMYMRCQEEQEHRLKSLTANIKQTQEAKKAPIKQTKMAYVDTIVKPPRNVLRKQAQHGTAHASTASPAARVAALASAPNVLRGGSVRPPPSAPVSSSNFNKPKKAPLMQKALQFMRGRKR